MTRSGEGLVLAACAVPAIAGTSRATIVTVGTSIVTASVAMRMRPSR
ncbi:MAG TPA: hypothetical protein VK162_06205 [Streptosporangiaceae bacterium]|nr:hypothetical protein [Streptosporangiaceae bacterium]